MAKPAVGGGIPVHFYGRNPLQNPEDNHVLNRAAYVVIGVNIEGNKDIIGIWIGENETSKFWLGVLNELKNRGVDDVLMFCVDGLTGLKEAITAAFPKAEIQRCIIHQLRNSFKYVSYKDIKAFSKDFKDVYTAASEEAALERLNELRDKWGRQYLFHCLFSTIKTPISLSPSNAPKE